ncbi:hypothetical protein [Streptomyces roseoverticillatus]|uniref:hypothetical protein n=1 Tax=Streptomyces roseoverticillatus TaxID=66429 RepID=UPI0004C0A1D7|nr:hypothetical protein [Streptomyces roseoverticillatus]
MRTAMLSSPRTTTDDQGELYRIAVPATETAIRVARDALQAILRAHPAVIEDARVCVSDAIAYVLAETPGHPTVTVTVRLHRTYVAFVIEDSDGPSRNLYHLTPRDLAAAPRLEIIRRMALYTGVSRMWDGRRRATSVYLALPIQRPVHELADCVGVLASPADPRRIRALWRLRRIAGWRTFRRRNGPSFG